MSQIPKVSFLGTSQTLPLNAAVTTSSSPLPSSRFRSAAALGFCEELCSSVCLLLVQVCWRGGRIVPVTQPAACCLSSSVCVSSVDPGAALPWCKLWSAGVLLAAPAPFWSHSWWCWKGSACGMDALVTITPGAEQLSWNHEGRPLFAGGYCHCLGGTWCSMIVPCLSPSLWHLLKPPLGREIYAYLIYTCAMAEFDGSVGSRMLQGQVVAGGALECLTCLGLMPASTEPAALLRYCQSLPITA